MRSIRGVLILGIVYILTGYAVGWFLGIPLQCAFLNLALGMILLILIDRNEAARARFFEGIFDVEEEVPLNFAIVLVIAIPPILLFVAFLWWVIGRFA